MSLVAVDAAFFVWECITLTAGLYVFVLIAVVLASNLTRTPMPKRLYFRDLYGRADRMQNILPSLLSAVMLGFFVSLLASYVHEGFRSQVAVIFALGDVEYAALLSCGVLLSIAIIMLLVEKSRTVAARLIYHPRTVNAAAAELLQGNSIVGVTAGTLEVTLARWDERAGASAAGILVRPGTSRHVNRLLRLRGTSKRVTGQLFSFSFALALAECADYPIRRIAGLSFFFVVMHLHWIGVLVALSFPWPLGEFRIVLAVHASMLVLQVCAGLMLVFSHARSTRRTWRIENIERSAAARRLKRLRQQASATPEVKSEASSRIIRAANLLAARYCAWIGRRT